MMSMTRRSVLAAAVLGLAVGAAERAEAGLVLGDSVNGTLTDPDTSIQYFTNTNTILVDPGEEFGGTSPFNPDITSFADLAPDTLTIGFRNTVDAGRGFAGFGLVYEFSDLAVAGGGVITGVFLQSTTGAFPLPIASTSFTDHSITIRLDDGSSVVLGNNETVSTTFGFETSSPTVVPEPASLATAGLGVLMGLGYAWRRRKRAA